MTTQNNHNKLVLQLRALIFYFGLVVSTMIIGPLILICAPLGVNRLYNISKWWTGFNIWWLKLCCKVDYEILGAEQLPNQPVIVLAKHQSTWETLFLHWYLPPQAWVLKRELLRLPLFGWALSLVGPIAIDRQSRAEAMRQLFEQGKANLDKGRWVLIFPEGTRTAPGQRRRYKLGGARLAAQTGYPIFPIAHNAGEYWRRRSLIKYPGTIKVVFGPLIESEGRTAQEINKQVEDWIETTIAKISTYQISSNRLD